MKWKWSDIKTMNTERISQRVLYILTGLTVVVFGLFYLIGFDRPFSDDSNFNAPLFTDLLMVYAAILLIGTLLLATLAMIKTVKMMRASENKVVNNIPVGRIRRYGMIALGVVIALSLPLSSGNPLTINGHVFDDYIALRVADLMIYTSLFLLVAAIGAVIFGMTRYRRENQLK
uniref:DUF2975 domain-containing protein n=1 Tax=Prevotella sp. GTC17254 TaxID=3236794 RepID=A0AB33IVE5_9BACT